MRYNLGRHYLDVAATSPDFPALIGEQAALSHAEFANLTQNLALHLRSLGIRQGSLVALNTTSTPVVLGMMFATALLGSGLVVAGQYLARETHLQPTHFLRSPEVAGHPAVPFQVLDTDWINSGKPTETLAPIDVDPEAPWLYLHTSGTTGTPKFLALSQRIVRDRSCAAEVDFPFRATTFATLFRCTSRPYLARATAAMLQACSIVDGADPQVWLRHGVDLVAASPVQIHRLLTEGPLPRKIARLEISGARIPADAAQTYLQSFRRVIDVYGASETAKSFANELRIGESGEIEILGLPQDSEVQILRDDGTLCEPNEMGKVRVRNPYMCDGYLGQPEATARAFKEGWFYPGDYAQWGARGELIVIGRADDVINLGGFKLQAEFADTIVGTVPGVKEAAVFRNPLPNAADPFIIFVVFVDKSQVQNVASEIVDTFNRVLGFGVSTRNIKPVVALPRDEDGLIDRAACARLVLARAAKTDAAR